MIKKEIKKLKEQTNRSELIHELDKYVHNFWKFWTIRSFCENQFCCKITINEVNKKQEKL